ncbi:MAG: orc1/cdc6 family replication initiation protein [Thermoplasmataceae archaeon]
MIIRNAEPLDFSYVPQKLRFRDKQIEVIDKLLIEPLRMGVSSNLLVYGDSGTGKTSTLKYLIRERNGVIGIYENTLTFGNMRSVLVDSLSKLGKILPAKSMSYVEIFRAFRKIAEDRGKNIFLVLDETTNLLKFDKDGLYNLLRAHEIYDSPVSTILVSMEDPSMYLTERDRKSVGIFSSILFNRYSKEELFNIIRERARLALMPDAYSDPVLEYMAEVAGEFGSARVAIELLQKSAYMCSYRGSESIEIDDVRGAKSMISPYVTESKLAELDRDDLTVLLAVCRTLKGLPSCDASEVIEEVRSLEEEFGERVGESSKIYKILRRLETVGLIEGRIMGKGDRKGVSKMISINDIPVSVLQDKILVMMGRS